MPFWRSKQFGTGGMRSATGLYILERPIKAVRKTVNRPKNCEFRRRGQKPATYRAIWFIFATKPCLAVNSRIPSRVSHAILFQISFRICSDPRTKKTWKSLFLFSPRPSRFPTGLTKLKFFNLFFFSHPRHFFLRCRPLLRRQEAVR